MKSLVLLVLHLSLAGVALAQGARLSAQNVVNHGVESMIFNGRQLNGEKKFYRLDGGIELNYPSTLALEKRLEIGKSMRALMDNCPECSVGVNVGGAPMVGVNVPSTPQRPLWPIDCSKKEISEGGFFVEESKYQELVRKADLYDQIKKGG